MGEASSYYMEGSIDEEFARREPTKNVWVTKDNRCIRVRDMSNDHIINTIAMLRKWAPGAILQDQLRLMAYQETAPDGATMAADYELASLEEIEMEWKMAGTTETLDDYLSQVVPTFDALIAEAERRKLTLKG